MHLDPAIGMGVHLGLGYRKCQLSDCGYGLFVCRHPRENHLDLVARGHAPINGDVHWQPRWEYFFRIEHIAWSKSDDGAGQHQAAFDFERQWIRLPCATARAVKRF
ncbi:hypothetical protein DVB73_24460 [Pseudomonas plecoglossicida]|uniref:Uncharacterized protein n=1 Tax=Pseudomonas plecoglossicida TaxID=70775 RepID=A0AAD0QZU4_PSEDL|nr:hypothetical protein DVB73_24460 [Pseudomonas plecoglossicida]EPB95867.1 hypothetical protein L321_11060 [Pseudomonas plecoglossicida NB2011]